jgi:hypothetical protein
MNRLPPLEFSPFEPIYYRHFRKRDNGWIAWTLENQGSGEMVASGIEPTFAQAKSALEAAVDQDLLRIAQSYEG